MADPNDRRARAYYDAEMRPMVRALIELPYPVLQEIRAVATSPTLPRSEKYARIRDRTDLDPGFLIDYAYWLPWDEIRPGMDPDEIEQYRSR